MKIKEALIRFRDFLKEDSWQSYTVFVILIILFIKLIFFPLLTAITGSSLPIVIVESCSMYHKNSFDTWWFLHDAQYNKFSITEEDFANYSFKNGLNKGDIIFVWGKAKYKEGDIIVFNAGKNNIPIIHRIVTKDPLGTKGDNNMGQITERNSLQKVDETNISSNQIIGKAVAKIPFLGWIKLILFYEPFVDQSQRGFCVENGNQNI